MERTPLTAWWECYDIHNFGDWITPFLIQKVTGVYPSHGNVGGHLFIAGSVLSQANEDTTVLGAGFMNYDDPVNSSNYLMVRGKLSVEKIRKDIPYCDPALFLPYYIHGSGGGGGMAIAPHYVDITVSERFGLPIINPTQDTEAYIKELTKYDSIITSSLHGIIACVSYGIPFAWVKLSDGIVGDGFKYADFFSTIDGMATCFDLREQENYDNIEFVKMNIDEPTVNEIHRYFVKNLIEYNELCNYTVF